MAHLKFDPAKLDTLNAVPLETAVADGVDMIDLCHELIDPGATCGETGDKSGLCRDLVPPRKTLP